MAQLLKSDDTRGAAPSLACSDIAVVLPAAFQLQSGERLAKPEINLRIYGDVARPIIVVAGGVSAGRGVADSAAGRGWWRETVGPGRAIDTQKFCVVGFDFLPNSGETARTISPQDQAFALGYALGIVTPGKVFAFVGASYGGMVGLAFAERFPERLHRLVVLSAAAHPHPAATALRGVQRRIIEFAKRAGRPQEGVSLARQLAMVGYRTPEEFDLRFKGDAPAQAGEDYPVCGYLRARGDAYKMDAERYVTLSDSIDRYEIDASEIETPVLLIGATSDRLTPIETMRALRDNLANAALIEISSLYGHDAFLKETGAIASPIADFLKEPHL